MTNFNMAGSFLFVCLFFVFFLRLNAEKKLGREDCGVNDSFRVMVRDY